MRPLHSLRPSDLVHLTWRGRRDAIWYRIRRLFIPPAQPHERCFMGAPIGEHAHCPYPAMDGSPWCRRCAPRPREDT